ncbi:PCYCGC motif-containing (lipo)protein [Paenibacillus yanchengensis]|uniref:PCYCGC motif-containing (Lipo)protein n=1 Tax=Paenibacillus yanchengensis TaxID=2035833 RepID=A0ABW4YNF7_9BACL
MKTKYWIVYSFMMVFGFATILTACSTAQEQLSYKKAQLVGSETWQSTNSVDMLPSFLDESTEYNRSLYANVGAHAHIMQEMNCYCGCMKGTKYDEAHDSLLRCYWAKTPDNTTEQAEIVWTDHSTTCGICKLELQKVIEMQADGKSVEEIKTTIDQEYTGQH